MDTIARMGTQLADISERLPHFCFKHNVIIDKIDNDAMLL